MVVGYTGSLKLVMPIELTDKAIQQLSTVLSEEKEIGIRVAVKGGGCAGYSYTLDFCSEGDDDDMHMDFDSFSVWIDPHTYTLINGTVLDYVDELYHSGFSFKNPNAKTTCGCGMSFA